MEQKDNKSFNCSVVIPCLRETEFMVKNRALLEKDPRITEFLYETATAPVGMARQKLLENAQSDYLFWLDDDVEFSSNPLDALFEQLKKDDKTAGVSCFIYEDNETSLFYQLQKKLLPEVYKRRQCHFTCALFRKKPLVEAGGFDVHLSVAEDHDMQLKLNTIGYEILGLKSAAQKHHIKRDPQKERQYFEGRKFMFNTYGYFEDDMDNIGLYSPAARWEMFRISKKYFFDKIKQNISRKLQYLSTLPSGILRNKLLWLFPEALKPLECGLLITENCIFQCGTCTYWKKKKQDLPLDKIKVIIDKLSLFGIGKIVLVGGEPLIRDDFGEIVDYVKSKNLKAGVVTNGFLGEKNMAALLKLDEITVSVDGMRENHNRIRGTNSWDKAIGLLYELKAVHGKNAKLAFVFQKGNYADLKTIALFMKKEGIPVDVLCYCSGGMGQPSEGSTRSIEGIDGALIADMDYSAELSRALGEIPEGLLGREKMEYLRLIEKKTAGKVDKQKCQVPNFKFMVDASGGVYPCSAWEKTVGNVLEQENFNVVWNSYRGLRKQIRSGNHPRCINCRSCELVINYVTGLNYLKKVFKII